MPVYIVHPKGRGAHSWQQRVTASSAQHAIASVLRGAGYSAHVSKRTGKVVSKAPGGGDGGMTARLASGTRRPNPRKAAKKRPSARACSSRAFRLKVSPSRAAGKGLRACRKNPSDPYTVKVYYANGRLMSSKSFPSISAAYTFAKSRSASPTAHGRRVEVYEGRDYIASARFGSILRA